MADRWYTWQNHHNETPCCFNFKMAAVHHLGFLKLHYLAAVELRDTMCIIVPCSRQISHTHTHHSHTHTHPSVIQLQTTLNSHNSTREAGHAVHDRYSNRHAVTHTSSKQTDSEKCRNSLRYRTKCDITLSPLQITESNLVILDGHEHAKRVKNFILKYSVVGEILSEYLRR